MAPFIRKSAAGKDGNKLLSKKKAKAMLRLVPQEIINERLQALRKQQAEAAATVQEKLQSMLKEGSESDHGQPTTVAPDSSLDPQPSLKLRAEDKSLAQIQERRFLESIVSMRVFHPQDAC